MSMTDGQAMKIARRIDELNWKICELCKELAEGHPNGEEMVEGRSGLKDQGFANPAWAQHILHSFLLNPEAWENDPRTGDIRHKGATKAVASRATDGD